MAKAQQAFYWSLAILLQNAFVRVSGQAGGLFGVTNQGDVSFSLLQPFRLLEFLQIFSSLSFARTLHLIGPQKSESTYCNFSAIGQSKSLAFVGLQAKYFGLICRYNYAGNLLCDIIWTGSMLICTGQCPIQVSLFDQEI